MVQRLFAGLNSLMVNTLAIFLLKLSGGPIVSLSFYFRNYYSEVIFTGIKLSSVFTTKDRALPQRQHIIIYSLTCPKETCVRGTYHSLPIRAAEHDGMKSSPNNGSTL